MIFALSDYYHYRRRSGRYARDIRAGPMAGAWENGIPPHVLAILSDFDALAFETFEFFGSWAIMYGTSSLISHVGMYKKPDQIVHMTARGLIIEPINNVFGPNVRILPLAWPPDKTKTVTMDEAIRPYRETPYGWRVVRNKALKILSGRHWHYWRWRFFIDVALLLFVLDVPVRLVTGRFLLSWLVPAYLVVVLFNAVLWRFHPLRPDEKNGAPADIVRLVLSNGGTAILDAYSLKGQDHGLPIYGPKETCSQ